MDVEPERVAELQREGTIQLIDVREDYEWEAGRIAGARHLALGELTAQAETIHRETPVVFYCRVGGRSAMAANAFRRAGLRRVHDDRGAGGVGGAGIAARARRRARGGPLILAWLALAAPAQAAPAARQGRRLRRRRRTRPRAPGDASARVRDRAARARARDPRRRGARDAVPRPDARSPRPTTNERGLLSVAFAPDYATSGRFYVYLTVTAAAATSGTPGEIQVREYRRSAADPDVADPATARLLLSIPPRRGGQPQRRAAAVRAGRQAVAGDRRRRRRQRPFGHAQDPASLLGKLIRLDPAGAGAGDRRARAAQPVAVLVRPRDRAARDRRRRPGRGRGDQRRAGRQLRLAVLRGHARGARPIPACDAARPPTPVLEKTHAGDGFCSITGGYVVRDPGPPDAARPLPLRRLLRGRAALGRSREPGGRRGRRALGGRR